MMQFDLALVMVTLKIAMRVVSSVYSKAQGSESC